MNEDDARRVDLSFEKSNTMNLRDLPNYGQQKPVDNRSGNAKLKCALCGLGDLQSGFGGCGDGFGYKSYKCRSCGGTTDFVYKDEIGKFFNAEAMDTDVDDEHIKP